MRDDEATFLRIGDLVADQLHDLADLQPPESILDIGSGYGRVAHALLRRDHRGPYLGVDILRKHVHWCQEHLSAGTDGQFEFHHLDVRNDRYNPKGETDPASVRLDFGRRFDVVLLASVFTHMWPDSIVHYLSELPTLLMESGRVMATFFLINPSQQAHQARGLSDYPLDHPHTDFARYWNPDDPLHVIGYDQDWIEKELSTAGLEISAVHLGSWCGREDASVYQDTLVLEHG